MRDRQVQYPNRFRLNAVSGQENVYDLVAVPGTVTQAGTALNKANLLSDATAALLGLTGNPTVNDALSGVGAKLKAVPKWHLLGEVTTSANTQGISMSLSDSLQNYKALYFYSSGMVNTSSNAWGVRVYLGNAIAEDYIAWLYSNKSGYAGYETWAMLPIIPVTSEQGSLPSIHKYTASGSNEASLYPVSSITEADWDCSNLYFVCQNTSGKVQTIEAGATIRVWGLA